MKKIIQTHPSATSQAATCQHRGENPSILYGFIKNNDLSVNLIGVRQFVIDGCAVQRWKGHGLHGDQLDFAGESPARICATRHPVDVFKDGG